MSKLNIIVTGLVGLHPVGGVAWDYLQYVIGLARLGHNVCYHEDTWSWPYDPLKKEHTDNARYSAKFISSFFALYATDLPTQWHYRHLHNTSYGITKAAFDEVARTADLFVNVSGANLIPHELSPDCIKIFLDTDPGYNQIVMSEKFQWAENVERWCEGVKGHDQHFTYAENIHGEDCGVPQLGIKWKTTRMPIVLDVWENLAGTIPPIDAPWSTVMTWDAFRGPLFFEGEEYKSKGAEFERVIDLPRHVPTPIELAIGGKGAPLGRLRRHGWRVIDGPNATLTPQTYASFINKSRGEFSTAKHVYVALRTGWFSCRTACYLAAARPAVVQDTGFTKVLPTGEGLLAFDSIGGATQALGEVESDYPHHSEAARAIAAEYFDSGRVLGKLIDDATTTHIT